MPAMKCRPTHTREVDTEVTACPNKRPPKIIDGVTEDGRRAVSVEQAAHYIGLGRSSMYKAVAAGQIKAVRVGSRWLVPVAEIERLTAVSDIA